MVYAPVVHPSPSPARLALRVAPFLVIASLFLCTCRTTGGGIDEVNIRAGGFRVASYNVNYGLSGDAAGISAAEETAADIIAYQEVTPGWARSLERLARRQGQRCRFDTDKHAGGLGVCSRFKILEVERIENPISWFFAQRIVVETPSGPVQVLNVHLRPPFSNTGNLVTGIFLTPSVRGAEMEIFFDALDPYLPTVVLGDFNEKSGEAIDYLDERGFESVLVKADCDSPTWHWTVPGDIDLTYTLDHIFVDPALQILDGYVIPAGRSDHYPVVGDLVMR